jgi:hypothetical protein
LHWRTELRENRHRSWVTREPLPVAYSGCAAEEQRDDREHGEDREGGTKPGDPGVAVGVEGGVGRLRADVRVVEGGLEVGVRDEGDSACELDLRLGLDAGGNRRALLDVRQEGRGECGDQDRAGERGSERGAEVGHRVLDAADLGALVVGDRGDGDGAELGGERTDPESDQELRYEDDLCARVLVERREQNERARE